MKDAANRITSQSAEPTCERRSRQRQGYSVSNCSHGIHIGSHDHSSALWRFQDGKSQVGQPDYKYLVCNRNMVCKCSYCYDVPSCSSCQKTNENVHISFPEQCTITNGLSQPTTSWNSNDVQCFACRPTGLCLCPLQQPYNAAVNCKHNVSQADSTRDSSQSNSPHITCYGGHKRNSLIVNAASFPMPVQIAKQKNFMLKKECGSCIKNPNIQTSDICSLRTPPASEEKAENIVPYSGGLCSNDIGDNSMKSKCLVNNHSGGQSYREPRKNLCFEGISEYASQRQYIEPETLFRNLTAEHNCDCQCMKQARGNKAVAEGGRETTLEYPVSAEVESGCVSVGLSAVQKAVAEPTSAKMLQGDHYDFSYKTNACQTDDHCNTVSLDYVPGFNGYSFVQHKAEACYSEPKYQKCLHYTKSCAKQSEKQHTDVNSFDDTLPCSVCPVGQFSEACLTWTPKTVTPIGATNGCDSAVVGRTKWPYSEDLFFGDSQFQQLDKPFHQTYQDKNICKALRSDISNYVCEDSSLAVRRSCPDDFANCGNSSGKNPISLSSLKPEQKQNNATQKKERVHYYPAYFKFYMEQHVENVMKLYHQRLERRKQLEEEMEELNLPEVDKQQCRSWLFQKESQYNRLKRTRMNRSLFETIKVLGRGAFGDVSLVRRRDSGVLYAMKTLKKKDVLRQQQIAHVKAERDLLAEADSNWVVKLYYSFQDSECLYFVMEYIAGGDLMGLLMKLKIFDHHMAQFYTAELVLAIESVHQLGYIHRDIKPDNILICLDGHLKLTDFGLCTGFHWTHNSEMYMTWQHQSDHFEGNPRSQRRSVARSLVGTPNYIAPEVLLQSGYTSCCDWWSVGVIVFEMLVGCPPFFSSTSLETQLKVINWQVTLDISKLANLSKDAVDLILQLCCDQNDRLGLAGAEEVKGHPFFRGIEFERLHKQTAPYIPQIAHPLDTSNFEDVEEFRHGQTGDEETATFHETASLDDTEHPFLDFTFRRFFNSDADK